MADIIVDTYKLKHYAQRIAAVNRRLVALDIRLDKLYSRVGLVDLFKLVQVDALTCYNYRLSQCQSYLQQTAFDFELAERLILNEDPLDFDGVSILDYYNAYSKTGHDTFIQTDIYEMMKKFISKTKPYAIASVISMYSPITGLLYITSGIAYGKTPSVTDPSRKPYSDTYHDWLGYEFSEDNPGVTAWIGKAGAEAENEWGHAGVNAYLGKAKAEADADFAFMQTKKKKEYKNGEWTETTVTEFVNAEIGASASASVLAIDGEAGLGTDMLGVEVQGEGSAGNVNLEAKGKLSIGDEGINANLQGEAMVSAVEGEAKGTINILGIEITGKIGGYAGALGVEGKVGIENNKFVMEGGVAALLGVSGGVEIGFNDEGWNNFVDFVTFWD